jgi:hypothetical protein
MNWTTLCVTQIVYGCDWNLCNTPRILNLLPQSLTYAVDTGLLNHLLISDSVQRSNSCLSCSICVNATDQINCSSTMCDGSCFIDDHIDDPQFNIDGCPVAFESSCVEQQNSTTVHISGNY